MIFLRKIKKGVTSLLKEWGKDDSYVKGEVFEDYVLKILFPKTKYFLLEKTHDSNVNEENFVKSSLKPDFKFKCKKTKKEFCIEAKFRSELYKNKIVWATTQQLKRYKEENKTAPVFICIGHGGSPSNPENIFIFPVNKAKYTGLYKSFLEDFEVTGGKAVTPKKLWSM